MFTRLKISIKEAGPDIKTVKVDVGLSDGVTNWDITIEGKPYSYQLPTKDYKVIKSKIDRGTINKGKLINDLKPYRTNNKPKDKFLSPEEIKKRIAAIQKNLKKNQ